MTITVAYNEHEGETKLRSFTSATDAEIFIEENKDAYEGYRCQMLVDYAEVKHYKDKFEELYEIMKNNMFGDSKESSKDKVII
jgi:hypothetical protein